jgi:hypothetical protein
VDYGRRTGLPKVSIIVPEERFESLDIREIGAVEERIVAIETVHTSLSTLVARQLASDAKYYRS